MPLARSREASLSASPCFCHSGGENDVSGPAHQTPVRTPACLFENSRFIDLGLLLKFTLESVMMDSGQRRLGILAGSDIMSRVDDESNDDFVVHKQSRDRIDLHVEQALEHIGGGGISGAGVV